MLVLLGAVHYQNPTTLESALLTVHLDCCLAIVLTFFGHLRNEQNGDQIQFMLVIHLLISYLPVTNVAICLLLSTEFSLGGLPSLIMFSMLLILYVCISLSGMKHFKKSLQELILKNLSS